MNEATPAAVAAASRTMPPRGTASRPSSNWGLKRATTSAPGATRATAGITRRREMNERSRVTRLGGSPGTDSRWRRLVRSRITHPLILGQPGQELAVPDVDCVDPRYPPRQQHIGETPGGGARVEADPAPAVDDEGVQGGGELLAAPARPGAPLAERAHHGGLPHPLGGAAGPAAVDLHHPRRHHGLGTLPRGGDTALHQREIEPLQRHRHGRRPRVAAPRPFGSRRRAEEEGSALTCVTLRAAEPTPSRTEMGDAIRRGSRRGRCPARAGAPGPGPAAPREGRRAGRRSHARAPEASRRRARRLRPPAG